MIKSQSEAALKLQVLLGPGFRVTITSGISMAVSVPGIREGGVAHLTRRKYLPRMAGEKALLEGEGDVESWDDMIKYAAERVPKDAQTLMERMALEVEVLRDALDKSAGENGDPMRVLILEDDYTQHSYMKDMLVASNVEFEFCTTVEDFKTAFTNKGPWDGFLLDHRVPGDQNGSHAAAFLVENGVGVGRIARISTFPEGKYPSGIEYFFKGAEFTDALGHVTCKR